MKRKVILYFMIIILLTLSLVMVVFGIALIRYYHLGIAQAFQNHVEAVNPIWENGNEFNHTALEDYSDLVIKNYQYDGAELELLNRAGKVLQSSTGFYAEQVRPIDKNVFSYKIVYQKEELTSGEKVLAVYIPLMKNGQTVGVLRYASSLTDVQETISRLINYGFSACIGVTALVFLVALRLADSIVRPFHQIIQFTQEISNGRFEKRIEENFPHELGKMASTLNYMADEIVKTDRLKTDFISSISHELRTPLTGIKGWAETMESPEGLTEEEMKFGLHMITSESERLMKLVEDLLDFSRYESKRITLVPDIVQYDELVQEVALQLQKKATEKNVQIKVKTTPVLIYADVDKIRQVLLNLLDNAIKFSKKGSGIHIVQFVQDGMAVLKIKDQGIGMKQEYVAHIMESFYKIDAKSVGAGLGLAIVRSIVHQHGGTIHIKSEYGSGTIIFVYLPMNKKNEE